MISYSKEIKQKLLSVQDKKRCCERMFSDSEKLKTEKNAEKRASLIESAASHFKCPSCPAAYIRGLFCVCGNVTDPSKRFHLELSFESSNEREAAENILSDAGVGMSEGERKGRFLLYIKSSDSIGDFLAMIGANNAAFDIMNLKIVNGVRGEANRQMNCDMANIRKSLAATQKYTDAINHLKEAGKFEMLPEEVRETAKLRLENTQLSMTDIGLLHRVPVSKSCVKHRLDKILDASENLKLKT